MIDLQSSIQPAVATIHLPSNNTLSVLTQDQLDQLYDWLLTLKYEIVQERLLEKFQLHASIPCLSRYFQRRQKHERIHNAVAAAKENLQLDSVLSPGQLQQLAAHAFSHLLLETTADNKAAESFPHLARWFSEQQQSQLKEQYLALARQHSNQNAERLELQRQRLALQTRAFEFDSVRMVMKHLVQLIKIHNLPNLDDEQKMELAHDVIFPDSDCTPNQNENQPSTQPNQ